jgi:hypothetical protein
MLVVCLAAPLSARYWQVDCWPDSGKKRVLVSAELHNLTKLLAKDDLDVRCFLPRVHALNPPYFSGRY